MENRTTDILDDNFQNKTFYQRRDLLPKWIKAFCWLFMITGSFVPVALILGVFGLKFQLAFSGMETNEPLSMTGMILLLYFALKGIAAFGLWTGKIWAIKLGQVDAVIGIIICIFFMFIYPFIDDKPGFSVDLRLELVLLIPYLLKLNKIKFDWENN